MGLRIRDAIAGSVDEVSCCNDVEVEEEGTNDDESAKGGGGRGGCSVIGVGDMCSELPMLPMLRPGITSSFLFFVDFLVSLPAILSFFGKSKKLSLMFSYFESLALGKRFQSS